MWTKSWWRCQICNKNHSISFTFPILFFVENHHFTKSHHSHNSHSCGWSIANGATLTNQTVAVRHRWQRILLATATKVVNPTLSSTLCQLFVGCNFVRTSPHTNPLATNHVRLAIQMPHTTHSHISCAHCKQLQHSHSLLSFIVATSCAAPLRAHHTRVWLCQSFVPLCRHRTMACAGSFFLNQGFSLFVCAHCWDLRRVLVHRVGLCSPPRCTCTESQPIHSVAVLSDLACLAGSASFG